MAKINQGDVVQVHYTGTLEDGTVFDTSEGREPLTFTVGEEKVIPGFERAVVGMEPGDEKTAELSPEQAYGPHREDMVQEMEQDQLPEDVDPEVGQQLQLRLQNGRTIPVVVTDVADGAVTIDANHPLAGKTLTFDIEVVDIGEDTDEDESQIVTP